MSEETFLDSAKQINLPIYDCPTCGRPRCLTPKEHACGLNCQKCDTDPEKEQ